MTLVLSVVLTPAWPIDLALRWFPDLFLPSLRTFDVDAQTFLLVVGIGLSALTVGLFVATEAWARRLEGRQPHLRERMLIGFLVTGAFTVGFVGARAVVTFGDAIRGAGRGLGAPVPGGEVWITGYHIHHFFFGFLLLVAAGWIALMHPAVSRRLVAILYGLGLGIFVDEWGLLLTFDDYYASSSWFAAITFLALLVAALFWTFGTVRDDAEMERQDAGAPVETDRGGAEG